MNPIRLFTDEDMYGAIAPALRQMGFDDFAALHADWLATGKRHAGIIVSSQLPIGDVLRRLSTLASALDADAMIDRLEYLSDW
jgi:hypothetical protein